MHFCGQKEWVKLQVFQSLIESLLKWYSQPLVSCPISVETNKRNWTKSSLFHSILCCVRLLKQVTDNSNPNTCLPSHLNNTATSTSDHKASRNVQIHVRYVVLPFMEHSHRYSAAKKHMYANTHNQEVFKTCWSVCMGRNGSEFFKTYSSSLIVLQQSSHIRTWNSNPMMGQVECLELHFPQIALPHFLQWCYNTKK